jgi:metal-responsive CopG/Arc/MetJ family transcriptional regulator
MKVKTSVTISDDVLRAVDSLSGPRSNRSAFIETAVRRFVEHLRRERRNAKDLEVINRRSKRLNREAAEVLELQGLP